MTINDIKAITIHMVDKDGNGYISPVSKENFAILVQLFKFIPAEKLNLKVETFDINENEE